jgi:hypothetical protein
MTDERVVPVHMMRLRLYGVKQPEHWCDCYVNHVKWTDAIENYQMLKISFDRVHFLIFLKIAKI